MISQQDWSAIEETLYLNAMPNLANELIASNVSDDADFVDEEEMDW
jgi:PHD/YefM family antitoxin component YafN of YafNO toxin-antitoxin module